MNDLISATSQGKTIVSFTVGLSAEFGYKSRFEDESHGTVRGPHPSPHY
jgi:hypothetical protein